MDEGHWLSVAVEGENVLNLPSDICSDGNECNFGIKIDDSKLGGDVEIDRGDNCFKSVDFKDMSIVPNATCCDEC